MHRKLEQYHRESVGWALVCCHWNRDRALDTLQQAYLKILEGKAQYKNQSSFKTWLLGVIRITALENYRQASLQDKIRERIELLRPQNSYPSTDLDELNNQEALAARLKSTLLKLSKRQRSVLHLVFYQDMTIEQAAVVMQIPLGTARKHYARGKEQLRKRLLSKGDVQWENMILSNEK